MILRAEEQTISKSDIEDRLADFMAYFESSVPLPMVVKMAVAQFMPMLPELMASKSGQQELLSLIDKVAYLIGYNVIFVPDVIDIDDIAALTI